MNKQKILAKTKEFLLSNKEDNIEEKMEIMNKIVSKSNRKDYYSLLYDYICDYLDKYFYVDNICEFKCNTCIKKRLLAKKNNTKPYENGCCYGVIKKKLCSYLGKDGRCTIRNVACKLYTCNYLKEKGYHFKLKNIYLSKYTLSPIQKHYLTHKFFEPKEKVLKGLLRRP